MFFMEEAKSIPLSDHFIFFIFNTNNKLRFELPVKFIIVFGGPHAVWVTLGQLNRPNLANINGFQVVVGVVIIDVGEVHVDQLRSSPTLRNLQQDPHGLIFVINSSLLEYH